MPLPETLRVNDPYPSREPNMNTTIHRISEEDTTSYEDAQYRIFMRWLVTLAVLIVVTTACYVMVGCNPQDYPGAPEASAAPHNEAGDLRSVK